MKRILEEGRYVKRKKCWNCGCLFEYEKEDIEVKLVFLSATDIFPRDRQVVTCPCCNKDIILYKNKKYKHKERKIENEK